MRMLVTVKNPENDRVLSAPPKMQPRAFELILETPKKGPKEAAFALALQTILPEYQKFIAYGRNL